MRILLSCVIVVVLGIHASCSSGNSAEVNSPDPTNTAAKSQPAPTSVAATAEFNEPKMAAIDALSKLRQLLTASENFREMGFDNLEQVDRASLSEPATVYAVGLDQLRNYTVGSNPQDLLIDTKRMVFPVVADGNGRTLITVEQKEGKWQLVSFGDQRVAANMVRVRQDKSSGPGGLSTSNYFVVQVKALFLTFLGNHQPGSSAAHSMRLVPLNGKIELEMSPAFQRNKSFLIANPQFNAEAEGTMKAKDVFSELSSTAKKIDSSTPF